VIQQGRVDAIESAVMKHAAKGHAGPHAGHAGGSALEAVTKPATGRKIISWNLLRTIGASLEDVVQLIERERPDLLLMQEATSQFEGLAAQVGGHYAWEPLPGRIHGLAMWTPVAWHRAPVVRPLPRGSMIQRVCQIVDLGDFGVANVHLSHGQVLNRRQLRTIAALLPPHAAVLGDFNLVGPTLLPGFRDVGPRHPTHVMGEIVPLRIDRCMVRGLICHGTRVLPRERSDHRPIVVRLSAGPLHVERPLVRYMAAAAGYRHRAAALAGFSR
jgi:endonuclease/exonuclease/phosphatase family metal-dependent hydrolase